MYSSMIRNCTRPYIDILTASHWEFPTYIDLLTASSCEFPTGFILAFWHWENNSSCLHTGRYSQTQEPCRDDHRRPPRWCDGARVFCGLPERSVWSRRTICQWTNWRACTSASCVFSLIQLVSVRRGRRRLEKWFSENQSAQVTHCFSTDSCGHPCSIWQSLFSPLLADISKLRPIKDLLPETVSYGQIKLTIAVMVIKTGFVRPVKSPLSPTLPSSSASDTSLPTVSSPWEL